MDVQKSRTGVLKDVVFRACLCFTVSAVLYTAVMALMLADSAGEPAAVFAVSKLYDYPRCFRGIRRFIPDFRREGAAFCCEADNPHRTAVRRDAVRVPADGGCQQRRGRFNGVVCIPVDAAVHRCLCGKLFDFVAGTQVQNAIMAKSLPPIRA